MSAVDNSSLILSTERLLLKRPQLADLKSIYEATKSPSFNDGMIWEAPEKIEDLIPFQNQIEDNWDQNISFTFSIHLKDSNMFIGRIGIVPAASRNKTNTNMASDNEDNIWDIGFFTIPEYQGKGYMSEALSVVIDFGFSKLKAKEIKSGYAVWNIASKKVQEKAGMKFKDFREQGFLKDGEWVAENRTAITREEWIKNHA